MENTASLSLPLPVDAASPTALDRLLVRAPSSDPHFADAVTRALGDQPGQRLLELLERGDLGGLTGSDGATCEAHAAKRLLELGYPWALHLTPRQLDSVRALPKPPGVRPRGAAFVVSAMAVGLGAIPAFIGFLELISEGTMRSEQLFSLLSIGVVVVNLLFALGRLKRLPATVIAVVASGISWLGTSTNLPVPLGFWAWVFIAWLTTLLAVRSPGSDPER